MDDHNKRSQMIWDTVKVSVNFKDQQVVDLGCGHGDFIWRAYQEGAIYVLGVDQDPAICTKALERCRAMGVPSTIACERIEEWIIRKIDNSFTYFDIVLCFSVLPYLKITYNEAISMIADLAWTAFFELQYIGDGPGKELRDDRDALELFKQFYNDVEKIGFTRAKPHHTRTIWRCREGGRYR